MEEERKEPSRHDPRPAQHVTAVVLWRKPSRASTPAHAPGPLLSLTLMAPSSPWLIFSNASSTSWHQ